MASKPTAQKTTSLRNRKSVARASSARTLINGRWHTIFEQAIGEDVAAGMILEYVEEHVHGSMLRKIRALQRAAHIASACEDYAINGKSAPL